MISQLNNLHETYRDASEIRQRRMKTFFSSRNILNEKFRCTKHFPFVAWHMNVYGFKI